MKKNIFRFLIITISFLLIVKCANQLPPQGGEVDKIPPEIISVYPANGTVNYHENYIALEFSEYVDKRSVQNAFFISPYIDGQIEFDWSGREVEIIFPDSSIKPNTTYNVTIGTEVKDIHNNNKMIAPLNFSFSTGAKIDSGKISGKVYGEKVDGIMIFAYRLSEGKDLNPLKNKPDYISQVGADGNFQITGLADDYYRIYAIDDKFKDMLYNPGDDRYGAPYTDVKIGGDTNKFNNLNFKITLEDTVKPFPLSAVMTDKNHIVIEFNEFIDSSAVNGGNFLIVDSLNYTEYPVKYFFKGKTKKFKYVVAIDSGLQKSNKLFLNILNVPDMSGNVSGRQSIEFLYNNKPDTNYIDVLKIKTDYEKNLVDYFHPTLTIRFSDAAEKASIKKSINLVDGKENKLAYRLQFINDAEVKVKILDKLNFRKKYSLKINLNLLKDLAGNSLDSVYTFSFNSVNKLDYSGVSGKFRTPPDSSEDIMVKLFSVDDNKLEYNGKLRKGNYEFKDVYPGKYFLWYFIDSDSSGTYNYGKVYPFQPSERFNYYPDTLKLRPRWPVGDIILQ